MEFSLIVPLWNEGENVNNLIDMVANSGLLDNGLSELILVNNGSLDDTGVRVDNCAKLYPWIIPIHLTENLNYGGGVYEGFKYAKNDILAYIPGDLQVTCDDLMKVWNVFQNSVEDQSNLFVKGNRVVRHDPFQTRFISLVYTFIANIILGLHVRDVNGLPKMFHRSLVDHIPAERMKTFVFDSQLLSIARDNGVVIKEVPVTFYARRTGVSSWSRKKIRVYVQVFKQILRLRKLRNVAGVKLVRL